MREILFRGKRNNGIWEEGSYIISCEKHYIYHGIYYEVIPETIGQYTGLCDKNGKKIFEGDIIHSFYANCRINEHIEKVVFFDGSFQSANEKGDFFVKISGKGSPTHLPQDTSVYMIECEIIGNIHDNPELLKGGGE